jgi:hypothetical protein
MKVSLKAQASNPHPPFLLLIKNHDNATLLGAILRVDNLSLMSNTIMPSILSVAISYSGVGGLSHNNNDDVYSARGPLQTV